MLALSLEKDEWIYIEIGGEVLRMSKNPKTSGARIVLDAPKSVKIWRRKKELSEMWNERTH